MPARPPELCGYLGVAPGNRSACNREPLGGDRSAIRKEIQAEPSPERTGLFTSGIVSQGGRHPIALYFTIRRHAVENLARVLARREPGRAPPVQMRDGLKHNNPPGYATAPCGCAVHAHRNFVELQADFPEECRRVVASFAEIYRVEAQDQASGLDAQERLAAHQAPASG